MVSRPLKKAAQFLASPTSVEAPLSFGNPPITAMSSSSRAKFYRRRMRVKTRRLERDARQIRRQLGNLEIVLQVQRHLSTRLPQTITRQRILAHIGDFIVQAKYLKTKETHELHRHELQVQSIESYNPTDACIVRLNATLTGSYDNPTIDRLYAAVPGNSALLSHLMHGRMAFACSFVFFFSADGAIEGETVEIELVRGLLPLSRNLSDVRALLEAQSPLLSGTSHEEIKRERNT